LSLLRLKPFSYFLPSFFLSTKCYSGIDSSCLVSQIFFVCLQTRAEYGFLLKIRQ
jgi:hypothetical protein